LRSEGGRRGGAQSKERESEEKRKLIRDSMSEADATQSLTIYVPENNFLLAFVVVYGEQSNNFSFFSLI
jgi:hypothetical protein